MTKYNVFTGSDDQGAPIIYVQHGQEVSHVTNWQYVSRETLEGIGDALDTRLNGLDPLQLFVKEIASGNMSPSTIIASAKELLREDE